MGLKNFLRRWLEVPEGYVEIAIAGPEPVAAIVPVSSPVDPDWKPPVVDPKVADALAIGGVIHGTAPVKPAPRHTPRKIPNGKPSIACVVDPNDPAALLGAMKR